MSYDARFRRTKIVATLGPATSTEEAIRALLDAGVNVFRINSSHGTPATRSGLMDIVTGIREDTGKPVGLLVDLQGPRIRVGALPQPLELTKGAEVVFAPEGKAQLGEIPTTYDALSKDVSPGDRILLDDGLLGVEVLVVAPSIVRARVKYGGTLTSHKGMNLPGVRLSAPAVTPRDREDIRLASEHGADFIGLSFVRHPEQIWAVRGLIPEHLRIVSKIELATAMDDLDRIVEATDAIMVARGDLGVELPYEEVPLAQKRVIQLSNQLGRPVITATQMLESMIERPRPTRAEASDVANAVLDGTDAVMLSAETAVGANPVESVRAMARIVEHVERSVLVDQLPRRRRSDRVFANGEPSVADAIAVATVTAADMLHVTMIVCFTSSGFTAQQVAAARPTTPIVGLTPEPVTFRQMALTWGVLPVFADRQPTYEKMLDFAREALNELGYVAPGEQVVVTAGVPFDVPGTTNLLKVEVL
jgi:pyruvate kinase